MKKIIALYLPQFHEIPENNKWWGEGFTEWVNVKKAMPLFEGHDQPKIPLDCNYYDLSEIDVMKWQTKIAKDNGIYGFCFYHYWFYEKPLLEKPIINFLNDKSINFPFCICWANESWTNGWAKEDSSIIMEQKYGEKEEWKKHFEFLLPFFKDERYIKENNKPLVVVYRPYLFKRMSEMMDYWEELAKDNGLSGVVFASQKYENRDNNRMLYDRLDYHIEYQPDQSWIEKKSAIKTIKQTLHDVVYKFLNKDISVSQKIKGPKKIFYDNMWDAIIKHHPNDIKAIAGGFVNWDNTPRHNRRGSVYVGSTPEKFGSFMYKQFIHIDKEYKNDYLFLFAWNEWGEGGYLEPDEKNGYQYLEAIKKSLEEYDKTNKRKN